MKNTIEIRDLKKKFGTFEAVGGISLHIKEGETFGLLGPNGAGKTTTLSILSTISESTSGKASVCGFDVQKNKSEVRKSIGIVFQDPALDDELTGRENLDFHGRMYGIKKSEREKKIVELIKLVDLESKIDNQVKTYSGGMKRRLEIIRGLMHAPKALFLDEPTIGLDPQTRRKLWEYIKQIRKEHGLTIILTTHYMEEADFLCDRIAIIDKGKIIALDTPIKLKENLGGDIIELEVSDIGSMQSALKKLKSVIEVSKTDDRLNVVVKSGKEMIPKIIEAARKNNIVVNSVLLKQPTLEDVFIHFTGRSMREEEGSETERARRMWKIQKAR